MRSAVGVFGVFCLGVIVIEVVSGLLRVLGGFGISEFRGLRFGV